MACAGGLRRFRLGQLPARHPELADLHEPGHETRAERQRLAQARLRVGARGEFPVQVGRIENGVELGFSLLTRLLLFFSAAKPPCKIHCRRMRHGLSRASVLYGA
jgi:hypothetical protein